MAGYHIWTIGCQMNKADSERLVWALEGRGHKVVPLEEADLVVVNSCVVRQSAENRVLSKLGSLQSLKRERPQALIALMGCLVDSQVGELRRRFPHVDLFLKPQEYEALLEEARLRWPGKDSLLPPPSPATFVPVIQGCDNFCSYCIVPYRRGRERSRPMREVLCEVENLVKRGVKEVTLLGQNVNSYGHDLPHRPDLADLLEALHAIQGLSRLRFLTSHPRDITPKFIATLARLEKVCEHMSLPVQAGDDSILRAMGRGYTVEEYRRLVERLRSAIPGLALSTDVIVGFPGKSPEQFEKTVALLEEIRFDTVHIACYSPRPGTLAARELVDDVPFSEKRRRLEKLEALQEGIASEINARLLGETVEVLVEGQRKGKWEGRTRTNKLVFFEGGTYCLGQTVRVKIEGTSPWWLQGRPVA